ncbi:glycosyltransferase family 2 protein (plasmid) [Pedobacter sp. BS3]|uniref:glycosyltransferase family 2 protein n=1 Tax=Pedobacter sp. BS3 TaxID=2567937 RepID=UPI0011ED3DA8|nr:glycosyltransferase family 2 protein [Pedobacter sp. BS3]TZF86207.1 glycosyltransferase family 2 protein [Pedobacter sp. BS3]
MISICIPVYKAQSYLKDTLYCLSRQTYKELELILVNDGDGLDYTAIIESFPQLPIQYIIQKNAGAGAARNTAFKYSRGKYIKFLDADDLLSPDCIEQQLKLAEANPGKIVSGKWGRFYNNDITTFRLSPESVWKNCDGKTWIIESWSQGPNMTQPGIFLIPRDLINKQGLWQEELSQGPCDDMEFYTRLILYSEGIAFCPQAILYYRSGQANSLSGLKSTVSFEWYLETVKRSVGYLLEKYPADKASRQAAAIQYQIVGYKAYPYNRAVSREALNEAKKLGGSGYSYPAGGMTQFLNNIFGWRNIIRLKQLIGYPKIN